MYHVSWLFRVFIAACILYLTCQTHASTQQFEELNNAASHQSVEKRIAKVVDKFENRVLPSLPRATRVSFNGVSIKVVHTKAPIASAGDGLDGPYIEISTGLVKMIEYLESTSIHSRTFFAGPCHYDYVLSIFNAILDGRNIDGFKEPEQSYEEDCSCPRFSHADLVSNPWGNRMTNGGQELALFFVLLHELAHHVNGDIQSNQSSDYPEGMELAADEWAVKMAKRARITFESSLSTLSLVFMFDQGAHGIDVAERRYNQVVNLIASSINPDTGIVRFSQLGREFALRQVEGVRSYSGFFRRIRLHSRESKDKECEPRTRINYDLLFRNRFGDVGMSRDAHF